MRISDWSSDVCSSDLVDAFPSVPNHGNRILRVFSNINPHGKSRIWRLGEPFEEVAKRFLPQIRMPLKATSILLKALNITKSKRTLYDHYMLKMQIGRAHV